MKTLEECIRWLSDKHGMISFNDLHCNGINVFCYGKMVNIRTGKFPDIIEATIDAIKELRHRYEFDRERARAWRSGL